MKANVRAGAARPDVFKFFWSPTTTCQGQRQGEICKAQSTGEKTWGTEREGPLGPGTNDGSTGLEEIHGRTLPFLGLCTQTGRLRPMPTAILVLLDCIGSQVARYWLWEMQGVSGPPAEPAYLAYSRAARQVAPEGQRANRSASGVPTLAPIKTWPITPSLDIAILMRRCRGSMIGRDAAAGCCITSVGQTLSWRTKHDNSAQAPKEALGSDTSWTRQRQGNADRKGGCGVCPAVTNPCLGMALRNANCGSLGRDCQTWD
ncbi:hypothetical protein B0J13DRAFT_524198 [Dactylonectria estremocensis]|uniref:Uncharacterized protein n=1 Tax=Dactylonectria estremocensis TaxID=1079267 RepID=A0A9P9J624_9HYPO|nr:hypothetical protein B0J13DRAFT_524198 [Dactylonectria estremocensis]